MRKPPTETRFLCVMSTATYFCEKLNLTREKACKRYEINGSIHIMQLWITCISRFVWNPDFTDEVV